MPVFQENFFVGLSGKNKPFFSSKLRKIGIAKIFP
jgi:hypothetical protein